MVNMILANLTLKTTDIDSTTTHDHYYGTTINNSVGFITNNRCNTTWRNLDFKRIVGDEMFYKYKIFNIGLSSIAFSAAGSGDTVSDNERTVSIILKGLPFTNGENIQNGVVTTVINHSSAASSVYNDNTLNTQFFTFYKQEYLNINIMLKQLSTDDFPAYVDSNELFGHQIYNFVIVPVE